MEEDVNCFYTETTTADIHFRKQTQSQHIHTHTHNYAQTVTLLMETSKGDEGEFLGSF